MTILNRFNDKSFRALIREIQSNDSIGDMVKQASIDPEDINSLPSSAFAWQARRLFPIHSAADATLSYLYVEKNAAAVPDEVRQEVIDAMELYGVDRPAVSRHEKTASAPEPFFLLEDRRRWAVSSPDTIKLAESALHERSQDLSHVEKTAAAVRLVNKARELQQEVSLPTLQKAGMVASDLNIVRDWLYSRAYAAPSHAIEFEKIADELATVEPLCYDRTTLVKLASAINALDQEAGLSRLYNRTLPDPVDTVFNTTKLAEATVDLGGRSVPISKLASVPLEYYSDVFGDDIISEITDGQGELDLQKVAQVIATMPRDLKMIFRRQFSL